MPWSHRGWHGLRMSITQLWEVRVRAREGLQDALREDKKGLGGGGRMLPLCEVTNGNSRVLGCA